MEHLVNLVSQEPLRFQPGTRFEWSNLGSMVFGRIVEVLTGRQFNEYHREQILDPLGMEDTYWLRELNTELAPRVAKVHRQVGDSLDVAFVYPTVFPYRNAGPNSAVVTTVSDMAKFVQMLLNDGVYDGNRILAPFTARLMTQSHTQGLEVAFGLGWPVQSATSTLAEGPLLWGRKHIHPCTFGHTGGLGTFLWADRRYELIGALFFPWFDPGFDQLNSYRNRFQHLVYASLTKKTLREVDKAPRSCDTH
jgi:CubicO group peptidase (beta-lactamase class C family)